MIMLNVLKLTCYLGKSEMKFQIQIDNLTFCSVKSIGYGKVELLQLKLTPIICLMNFLNQQVGNGKN